MAMPFIFNTLEYANKLVAAGVPKTQAEAQAQALHEALSEGTVTPGDLLILKTDLITRIEAVKHEFITRLEAVKHELITRIDSVTHDVDVLKQDVDVLKHDVGILKRKVNALFWLVGFGLVLHAVEIGALIYIIGRLP